MRQMISDDLYKFCYFYDRLGFYHYLSQLALPEPWRFLHPTFETTNIETPILEKYIRSVFRHLAISYNNTPVDADVDQILFLRGTWLCFHTGLYTSYFEPIYALMEGNRWPEAKFAWVFKGFYEKSSPYLRCIPILPDKPVFAHLFEAFHPEWNIRIHYAHILENPDNLQRIPEKIRQMDNLPLLMDAAVRYAQHLVSMDIGIAVPQFYAGKVQYLVPICLTGLRHCDLALTLTPCDGTYLGTTCLTLEMAYNNARLLYNPSAPWLSSLVDPEAGNYTFAYQPIFSIS